MFSFRMLATPLALFLAFAPIPVTSAMSPGTSCLRSACAQRCAEAVRSAATSGVGDSEEQEVNAVVSRRAADGQRSQIETRLRPESLNLSEEQELNRTTNSEPPMGDYDRRNINLEDRFRRAFELWTIPLGTVEREF